MKSWLENKPAGRSPHSCRTPAGCSQQAPGGGAVSLPHSELPQHDSESIHGVRNPELGEAGARHVQRRGLVKGLRKPIWRLLQCLQHLGIMVESSQPASGAPPERGWKEPLETLSSQQLHPPTTCALVPENVIGTRGKSCGPGSLERDQGALLRETLAPLSRRAGGRQTRTTELWTWNVQAARGMVSGMALWVQGIQRCPPAVMPKESLLRRVSGQRRGCLHSLRLSSVCGQRSGLFRTPGHASCWARVWRAAGGSPIPDLDLSTSRRVTLPGAACIPPSAVG